MKRTILTIALLLGFAAVPLRAAPTITYHKIGGYFEGHDDRPQSETYDYREWLTRSGDNSLFSNEFTNIYAIDYQHPTNKVGFYGGCYEDGIYFCSSAFLYDPGRYKSNWFDFDMTAPWPYQNLVRFEKIKTSVTYYYPQASGWYHRFAGTNIGGFKVSGSSQSWDVTIRLRIYDCSPNPQSYMHEFYDVHAYPIRSYTAWTQDWFCKAYGSGLGVPYPLSGYWEWKFTVPNNYVVDYTPYRNAGDPNWIQWEFAEQPIVVPHQH